MFLERSKMVGLDGATLYVLKEDKTNVAFIWAHRAVLNNGYWNLYLNGYNKYHFSMECELKEAEY
jgi:hypothetical protein